MDIAKQIPVTDAEQLNLMLATGYGALAGLGALLNECSDTIGAAATDRVRDLVAERVKAFPLRPDLVDPILRTIGRDTGSQ